MATNQFKIDGLEKTVANLNNTLQGVKTLTQAGLLEIGLVIQRKAQQRVPVHFGKLRASAYTRKKPEDSSAVEVGFTAAYAAWVHENLAMKWRGKPRKDKIGVYWGPNGTARFLSKAVADTRAEIVSFLAKKVTPKGSR